MTIPLQTSVVYGPVHSRRLGNSLGINVLPADVKFCLSNCVYCQYGWTDREAMKKVKFRPAKELLEYIEAGFIRNSFSKERIDSITFSGNGEPTLHPEFGKLVREVKNLRDRYFPGVPISVLSDSSRVHLPEVREALEQLDERYMKLDAGDPATFQKINNPIVSRDLEPMIRGLVHLQQVTIQSLFISEPIDNSSNQVLRHWLETLLRIRPRGLQIYTVSRSTADPRVKPVSKKRLNEIAHLACQVTDLSTVTCVTDTHVELV